MKVSKIQQIFIKNFKLFGPNLAKNCLVFQRIKQNFKILHNLMKFHETQQNLMMLNNNFVYFYQIR